MYIPKSVNDVGAQAFWACESLLLDVSDNAYVEERAAEENWETGVIDTTFLYLIVILSITVVGTVLIVFVWHKIKHRREKKKQAE